MRHLVDPLNARAEAEHWGSWVLNVVFPTHYRTLEAIVADFIERGVEIPEDYSSDDLLFQQEEGTLDGYMADRRRAEEFGILFLIRGTADDDNVSVSGATGMRPLTGFLEPLGDAIERKAAQLLAARPRRTHLIVYVDRGGDSRDMDVTPVPFLPDAIDRVWVLHRRATLSW